MTHTSVRWTHVLLGVGLTLVVAIAPLMFVLGSRISVQANGSQLPVYQAVGVIIAAAAVSALLFTIAVSTRAERER